MSAFLVDDITIDRILSHLKATKNDDDLIRSAFHKNIDSDEDLTIIGRELLRLNYRSLLNRYNDPIPEELDYKFKSVEVSPIQAVKSVECLMYQSCEEGLLITTESGYYKFLETLLHLWSSSIVHGLPEYDTAVWG